MPKTEDSLHPCFAAEGRRTASRLHLPVAPRANARLRYTPATVSQQAISPHDALGYLRSVTAGGLELDMVGITGPGDPFATPDSTLLTLELIREAYPELPLCVTTNGLGGEKVARELAGIGLSHVTILVNAVRPEVAEKLYLWIRPGTKTVPLPDACFQLVAEQERTIAALKREGITVKINTTVFTGLNAGHVEEVAKRVAELGADYMSVIPCRTDDTPAVDGEPLPCPPAPELMGMVRDRCAKHMKLTPAFEECGERVVGAAIPATHAAAPTLPKASEERPNVAVASSTGMDVDLHLGHAHQFLIYGRENGEKDGLIRLLGTRPAPEPGSGDNRWESAADTLNDCFALLAASAGARPREVLSQKGLRVIVTDGNIEGTVETLYGEGKKGKGKKKQPTV